VSSRSLLFTRWRAARASAAAQKRGAQARRQLSRLDGRREQVVRAGLERRGGIEPRLGRGNNHNRHVRGPFRGAQSDQGIDGFGGRVGDDRVRQGAGLGNRAGVHGRQGLHGELGQQQLAEPVVLLVGPCSTRMRRRG
jgi:hypothetical protein